MLKRPPGFLLHEHFSISPPHLLLGQSFFSSNSLNFVKKDFSSTFVSRKCIPVCSDFLTRKITSCVAFRPSFEHSHVAEGRRHSIIFHRWGLRISVGTRRGGGAESRMKMLAAEVTRASFDRAWKEPEPSRKVLQNFAWTSV